MGDNALCTAGCVVDNALCTAGCVVDNALCTTGCVMDNALCTAGCVVDNALCTDGVKCVESEEKGSALYKSFHRLNEEEEVVGFFLLLMKDASAELVHIFFSWIYVMSCLFCEKKSSVTG